MGGTAEKLVDGAADLIMRGGYHGFSYADLAERFGIRKASIHHHFPSKVDLVVEVVEQARARIRGQMDALSSGSPVAEECLLAYTGFWKRCIRDQTVPFCLGAILGAELPNLPDPVAAVVRAHFADLAGWIGEVLELGVQQGAVRLRASPQVEAEIFIAGVYGAMLAARALDDPDRFDTIVDAAFDRLRP